MRLLVIDDDLLLLRAITRFLRPTYEVVTASTPSGAFALLARDSYDAILCDVHMSGMSGLDFVAKLSPLHSERVVFITGDAAVAQEEFAVRHPVLTKPFTRVQVAAALASLMPSAA